jgi:hypothetical protein
MTKKITIITIITLLLLIGVTVLVYLPFLNFENTKNIIINWISSGKETKLTGRKITNYQNGDTFYSVYKDFYSKYDFVTTEYNPFNPIITAIKENISSKDLSIDIYKMQRINLMDFDLYEQRGATIKNKSFEEAVEIAKKYDLSKENPDPTNITVYPAPTKEEVERSKKLEEENQKRKSELETIQAKKTENRIITEQSLGIAIRSHNDCVGLLYPSQNTEELLKCKLERYMLELKESRLLDDKEEPINPQDKRHLEYIKTRETETNIKNYEKIMKETPPEQEIDDLIYDK